MGELALRNRCRHLPVNLAPLRQVLAGALADAALRGRAPRFDYDLGVHLVGPAAMARLNALYLGHDGPTDVITFDYGKPERAGSGERWLRGEIVICPAVARQAARRWGTTWHKELCRYVIHGLLHLSGYDDQTPQTRRAMKREENRLVRSLCSEPHSSAKADSSAERNRRSNSDSLAHALALQGRARVRARPRAGIESAVLGPSKRPV